MKADSFLNIIRSTGIDFFTGVPDSLLRPFITAIEEFILPEYHIPALNEGQAAAIAQGIFLQTGKPAVVYMQNSGLCNALNPLISMSASQVYGLPAVLIIGWRGKPGTEDEPQHRLQGAATEQLLKDADIPYMILSPEMEIDQYRIESLIFESSLQQRPSAFLIEKGTFSGKAKCSTRNNYPLKRKDIIKLIAEKYDKPVIATTGHTSRELFTVRGELGQPHNSDFLSVGGMGHLFSIATGLNAAGCRDLLCLDGDGAFLMHSGSLSLLRNKRSGIIRHIVFDNEAHLSVGGFPTISKKVKICDIAAAAGYKFCKILAQPSEMHLLDEFFKFNGDAFLQIKVNDMPVDSLPRPGRDITGFKYEFMNYITGSQQLFLGDIKKNLSLIIDKEKIKRVLLVTRSMRNRLECALSGININLKQFSSYTPNPDMGSLSEAMETLESEQFDAVIAMGGGSAIDSAKIIRSSLFPDSILIAVPTTCGSGAEATPFAVAYSDKVKISVETSEPDYVILDSTILAETPMSVLNAPIIDAVIQGIESLWAVSATAASRHSACRALGLLVPEIQHYVTGHSMNFTQLHLGAYLAGRAIAESKTTACHALSYGLTAEYGLKHGEAVALLLPGIIKVAYENRDDTLNRTLLLVFNIFGTSCLDEFLDQYNQMCSALNLRSTIKEPFLPDNLLSKISIERLNNHPVTLDKQTILNIYQELFETDFSRGEKEN